MGDARLCRHVDYFDCLARTDSALFGNSVKRHYRISNFDCAETNHLRTRCQSSRRKYRQDFLTGLRPTCARNDHRTIVDMKSSVIFHWGNTPPDRDHGCMIDPVGEACGLFPRDTRRTAPFASSALQPYKSDLKRRLRSASLAATDAGQRRDGTRANATARTRPA